MSEPRRQAPPLLHMTAPVREPFEIPCHDLGDRSAPPRLAFVAGIHGNELNGVFVLSRLAGFLSDVAAGTRPPLTLTARVVVIPAVNVLGVNTRRRTWPFDGTDINRMFPGYDAGETTQRIAWAVLEKTAPAALRIDIHSSNLDIEELPQVRLYAPSAAEREHARWFGLPAVVERPMNAIFTSTIGHAWRTAGGENFVIQCGHAGDLQLGHCERLFRSLVTFCCRSGVLQGTRIADEDDDTHYFGTRQTLPLIAKRAGVFVSKASIGAWLHTGDVIGYVYDTFDGSLRDEVRAPMPGLLSGLRRYPLLCEGDLVARLQTTGELSMEIADTFLHGHGQ